MSKKKTAKKKPPQEQQPEEQQPEEKQERQSRPCVDVIPAKCPACGSLESKVKTSRTDKSIVYRIAGVKYKGQIRQYRKCENCPQVFAVRIPINII